MSGFNFKNPLKTDVQNAYDDLNSAFMDEGLIKKSEIQELKEDYKDSILAKDFIDDVAEKFQDGNFSESDIQKLQDSYQEEGLDSKSFTDWESSWLDKYVEKISVSSWDLVDDYDAGYEGNKLRAQIIRSLVKLSSRYQFEVTEPMINELKMAVRESSPLVSHEAMTALLNLAKIYDSSYELALTVVSELLLDEQFDLNKKMHLADEIKNDFSSMGMYQGLAKKIVADPKQDEFLRLKMIGICNELGMGGDFLIAAEGELINSQVYDIRIEALKYLGKTHLLFADVAVGHLKNFIRNKSRSDEELEVAMVALGRLGANGRKLLQNIVAGPVWNKNFPNLKPFALLGLGESVKEVSKYLLFEDLDQAEKLKGHQIEKEVTNILYKEIKSNGENSYPIEASLALVNYMRFNNADDVQSVLNLLAKYIFSPHTDKTKQVECAFAYTSILNDSLSYEYESEKVTPILKKMLFHKFPRVQKSGIEGLGNVFTEDSLDILFKIALKTKNENHINTALDSIEKIMANIEVKSDFLPSIQSFLNDLYYKIIEMEKSGKRNNDFIHSLWESYDNIQSFVSP